MFPCLLPSLHSLRLSSLSPNPKTEFMSLEERNRTQAFGRFYPLEVSISSWLGGGWRGEAGQKTSRPPQMVISQPPEEEECVLSLAQTPALSFCRSRAAGLRAGCSTHECPRLTTLPEQHKCNMSLGSGESSAQPSSGTNIWLAQPGQGAGLEVFCPESQWANALKSVYLDRHRRKSN